MSMGWQHRLVMVAVMATLMHAAGRAEGATVDEALAVSAESIRAGDYTAARTTLEQAAAAHDLTDAQALTMALRIAGTRGAAGDLDAMHAALDQVQPGGDVSTAQVMEAYWSTARLFREARAYDAVHALLDRTRTLRDAARQIKRYTVRFDADIPPGAGGWAQWSFARNAAHRETRFERYIGADAELLIADITVDRRQAQAGDAGADVTTAFVMAYDAWGWHIYVHTQEPRVEQAMADGGRGASTLEMFFSPGLEGQVYYQWIINQATGHVDLFHWDSPHRDYRPLEESPWSLQTSSVKLDDGWGTLISIAWESLYDKLPFDGRDTWRFSAIRWSPSANVTWGGRVHETGRWGHIQFAPPTQAQRLAIQRHIIRRAWSRYRQAADALALRWNGPRGDETFHREHVQPLIEQHNAFRDRIESINEWDRQTIERVFEDNVPVWMTFEHEVEELRRRYLTDVLLNP